MKNSAEEVEKVNQTMYPDFQTVWVAIALDWHHIRNSTLNTYFHKVLTTMPRRSNLGTTEKCRTFYQLL